MGKQRRALPKGWNLGVIKSVVSRPQNWVSDRRAKINHRYTVLYMLTAFRRSGWLTSTSSMAETLPE